MDLGYLTTLSSVSKALDEAIEARRKVIGSRVPELRERMRAQATRFSMEAHNEMESLRQGGGNSALLEMTDTLQVEFNAAMEEDRNDPDLKALMEMHKQVLALRMDEFRRFKTAPQTD